MDLDRREFPASCRLSGSESITLMAGKRLKIETSPGGEEILDEEVPAGKSWKIRIAVSVEEM